MALTFETLILSQQFTFFISEDETAIVVHAAAIAATSPQLDALINGGMEESGARCARIENVGIDDFEENPLSSSSTVEKNQENNDHDGWGHSGTLSKKKKGKKGRLVLAPPPMEVDYAQQSLAINFSRLEAAPEPQHETRPVSQTPLRTQFNTRNYLTDGGPKALILQQFEPKPNSTEDQNFTPVLLAHARLYCFAHVRLIMPLKALTLDKLHKTLLSFKLYAERVGDIIELARYVYSNPDLPDRCDDGTLDDLKKLVVDYVVCEIDTIGKYDEFTKYVEEGGEFVGDLWRLVKNHIT